MSRFIQHYTNERNAEAHKEYEGKDKKKKLSEAEREMEEFKRQVRLDRDHEKRIRTSFR